MHTYAFRSEYWKSQPKKYCDFCKCWIADNKASIDFHESGRRHQAAVQVRLREISRKGAQDERRAKKEDDMIRMMEMNAMNDYRKKDLSGNPDLSAHIFLEKKAQRDAEREEEEESAEAEATNRQRLERAEIAVRAAEALAKRAAKDPMLEGMPEPTSSAAETDQGPSNKLRKIEAPKSGTKWHNKDSQPPKHWYEAKTEDGNTYYWHVETHGESAFFKQWHSLKTVLIFLESRWDPPPEGYLSISAQKKLNNKHEEREWIKKQKIAASQALHSKVSATETSPEAETGPPQRVDPYGGWKTVVTR